MTTISKPDTPGRHWGWEVLHEHGALAVYSATTTQGQHLVHVVLRDGDRVLARHLVPTEADVDALLDHVIATERHRVIAVVQRDYGLWLSPN